MPLITIWGVWLARNLVNLKDTLIAPYVAASNGLAIIKCFPQEEDPSTVIKITEEIIDRSYNWAYFDGSLQGILAIGGERGILHIFR